MDRTRALAHLAPLYAHALALRDQGYDHAAIAAAVGVEVEAVGPLLALAALKLERRMSDGSLSADIAPTAGRRTRRCRRSAADANG